MNRSALRRTASSLGVIVVAALAACAYETQTGPDRQQVGTISTGTAFAQGPDLGSCSNLAAPAGSKVRFHTYADGVQIYRWSGTGWSFVAPEAVLTSDANGTNVVGIHYVGPTWESSSGSKVVGAVVDRCFPDPNSIPWLILRAVSTQGPGVFDSVTHIQRVNTAGGNAPSSPGTVVGEEARVPYTTEYFFYRAK